MEDKFSKAYERNLQRWHDCQECLQFVWQGIFHNQIIETSIEVICCILKYNTKPYHLTGSLNASSTDLSENALRSGHQVGFK